MQFQDIGFLLVILVTSYAIASVYKKISERRFVENIAAAETKYLKKLSEESAARTRNNYDRVKDSWNGWRKFRIESIKSETDQVKSFYFKPHDNRHLPPFLPGQHLTIQVLVPGQEKPLIRCYSLSSAPSRDFYRISVKREVLQNKSGQQSFGIVSSFLHDLLREGDLVDLKSPSGNFNLDLSQHTPIVLIGGGIGITPVYSMLDSVISQNSKREVWFFLGVRNRTDHPMYEKLIEIAELNENVRLVVCYSDPLETCRLGVDYHYQGFVSTKLLNDLLPSGNYDFYFCGPPGMMDSLHEGFKTWGIPDSRLHFEAFGPATIGKMRASPDIQNESGFKVTFTRSNKEVTWAHESGSLLELAEANGISVNSGCRAGNCGTCVTAIKNGNVEYLNAPGNLPEEGTCLVCAAVPTSDLELDA